MSLNFSEKQRKVFRAIALPLWVFFGFMLAQAIVVTFVQLLALVGISFSAINESVFQAVASGIIYALSLVVVIGVPWLIKRHRTSREELGLQRLPSWMDLVWAPTGAVAYLILTTLITTAAMAFLPFVDFEQVQDTGFNLISERYEYVLAFIMLVIVAPVAEEILFRGYLFGKLRKYAPVWVAILITSLLFAVVHFAWNVGFDVFALSIVLCLLRVISGSLWPSILLHMMKNGLAFYFLFINPSILSTLG